METYIFRLFLLLTQTILIFASDWECNKVLNGTVSSGIHVSGTYDNRSVGNAELHGGDAVNYTFYFNIASNIAKDTPDPECDNYNITYRQAHGLEIGYCKDIASAGLLNATCRNPSKNMIPIQQKTAYQAKKQIPINVGDYMMV